MASPACVKHNGVEDRWGQGLVLHGFLTSHWPVWVAGGRLVVALAVLRGAQWCDVRSGIGDGREGPGVCQLIAHGLRAGFCTSCQVHTGYVKPSRAQRLDRRHHWQPTNLLSRMVCACSRGWMSGYRT